MNIFSCHIRRIVLLLLALLGVPMATLRAQEEKADGTNWVIVSKQDMRITVLCPRGDTLAVSHRLRTQLRRQAAGMGFPDTGRAFRDRVRGRYLPLAARLDEARNSRRDIRPPLLPLENTRLHGHRHTRDRQPPSDTRTDNDGLHTPQQ